MVWFAINISVDWKLVVIANLVFFLFLFFNTKRICNHTFKYIANLWVVFYLSLIGHVTYTLLQFLGMRIPGYLSTMQQPKHQSGQYVLQHNIAQLDFLRKSGVTVELHWIPAHIGVPGNEKVDQLAKEAAGCYKGSQRGEALAMIPKLKASCKRILKRVCHERWTQSWATNTTTGASYRRHLGAFLTITSTSSMRACLRPWAHSLSRWEWARSTWTRTCTRSRELNDLGASVGKATKQLHTYWKSVLCTGDRGTLSSTDTSSGTLNWYFQIHRLLWRLQTSCCLLVFSTSLGITVTRWKNSQFDTGEETVLTLWIKQMAARPCDTLTIGMIRGCGGPDHN